MSTPYQYMLLTSTPEKEARFAALKKQYGSFMAFHGSPMENWHSILHNGLRNMSTYYSISSLSPIIYFSYVKVIQRVCFMVRPMAQVSIWPPTLVPRKATCERDRLVPHPPHTAANLYLPINWFRDGQGVNLVHRHLVWLCVRSSAIHPFMVSITINGAT